MFEARSRIGITLGLIADSVTAGKESNNICYLDKGRNLLCYIVEDLSLILLDFFHSVADRC